MDRETLRQELVRDEGLRLVAYRDSVGLWTIGVGHLLGTSPRMSNITAREAYALMEADIDDALKVVLRLVPAFDALSDGRQRALANMAFNLGDRLEQFIHFLTAVRAADWIAAASEMMLSKWARQVGARALRLHDLVLGG